MFCLKQIVLILSISIVPFNCQSVCHERRFAQPNGELLEEVSNTANVGLCCSICDVTLACSSFSYFSGAQDCWLYANHTGFQYSEISNIVSAEVKLPSIVTNGPDTTTIRAPRCSLHSTERFPDQKDCSKYIQCAGELEIMESCWGWEMLFDYQLRRCKAYDEADCYPGSYKPATGTPGPTTTRPSTQLPTECPAIGVINIPNPLDCRKYVSCINGTGYPRDCPNSMEFDAVSGQCVNAGTGTCYIAPSTLWPPTTSQQMTSTTTTTEPLPSSCPPTGTINIPNPDDCRKYISCINGIGYPRDCPGSQEFDTVTGQCVAEGDASCANGPIPTTGLPPTMMTTVASTSTTTTPVITTTPRPIPSQCPPTGNTNIPHQSDCRKYITCINGVAYPRDCPNSQEFDAVTGQCVAVGTGNCFSVP